MRNETSNDRHWRQSLITPHRSDFSRRFIPVPKTARTIISVPLRLHRSGIAGEAGSVIRNGVEMQAPIRGLRRKWSPSGLQ